MSDQLIIVKLYVTTGSGKELIASILLRAFNSFLRIDLTLRKHSFLIFSLIEECCIPSLLVTPQIFITFLGFKIFNDRCGIKSNVLGFQKLSMEKCFGTFI